VLCLSPVFCISPLETLPGADRSPPGFLNPPPVVICENTFRLAKWEIHRHSCYHVYDFATSLSTTIIVATVSLQVCVLSFLLIFYMLCVCGCRVELAPSPRLLWARCRTPLYRRWVIQFWWRSGCTRL